MRHVTFQAALVVAHHNPSLRSFADRLRKAGKPHKIIITAVARKLVTIANALFRTRALRDHGCWFLYLPPYSPDLNPIQQAFSKLKAHLRRIGARTFTEVFDAIGRSVTSTTRKNAGTTLEPPDVPQVKVERL